MKGGGWVRISVGEMSAFERFGLVGYLPIPKVRAPMVKVRRTSMS